MQDLTLVAAIVATSLFAAMAAFQATLAAGMPVGAHVLGGRYADALPPRVRAFSGIAAVFLLAFAGVMLARAGVIGWPNGVAGLLAPAAWVIAGFLILNTLGNLACKSRFERTVLAATTAVLTVLCGFVAMAA
jgi:hypothetical protein